MFFAKLFPYAVFISSTLAMASYPDGTKWYVEDKFCGTAGMLVLPGEKIQFADSLFAKSSKTSETSSQECFQAWAYTRVISSISGAEGNYQEEAELEPAAIKTQCRDKSTGGIISENSRPWSREGTTMKAMLNGNQGKLSIYGSVECSGTLRLTLKK